jgi:hypothetical protein
MRRHTESAGGVVEPAFFADDRLRLGDRNDEGGFQSERAVLNAWYASTYRLR